MPTKDKRKLAAIMFIDIVGYSRMMGLNEERTLKILKDFENIGSSLIKENDGSIIKKIGDELFCEFSSAKKAVDSALAIQNALQSYNDSRPKDFKLQVPDHFLFLEQKIKAGNIEENTNCALSFRCF